MEKSREKFINYVDTELGRVTSDNIDSLIKYYCELYGYPLANDSEDDTL